MKTINKHYKKQPIPTLGNQQNTIYGLTKETSSKIQTIIKTSNNEKQVQNFLDKLPKINNAIDFTQFKKVGAGGTQDIFIFPNNQTFVIKLHRGIFNKVITVNQPSIPLDIRQNAEQYVKNKNTKYDQLYEYFGIENCLYERSSIQKIRINIDGALKEIETVISIQKYSNVFLNNNKIDFSTPYIETTLTEETKEIYKKINKTLLGDDKFNENDFLQLNKNIQPIFTLIDNDNTFKNAVKEFLLRFKKYFDTSGNFIDLAGKENVLFYKKDGVWKFQIGSVLKAETKQNVLEVLKILEEKPEFLNSNNANHQKKNLINGLALIRLFNAVGIKVGIGKIIDIKLTDKQLNNLDKIEFK